jgi:hypothetical protein
MQKILVILGLYWNPITLVLIWKALRQAFRSYHYFCRVSEIQKWCGCPWATRISNCTCPPKILVAHHQQIFDEQQQQIIWNVCPVDNWRAGGTCPQLWGVPGARTTNFRNPVL